MEQSPSWEANRFVASQKIPCVLLKPKVHYRIHKCPPPVSLLSQPNPVHTPTPHFLMINFLAASVSEPALYKLLPFQVPNLMSLFRCLGRTKLSVQVRGFVCKCFLTNIGLHSEELLTTCPNPSWRTTPCRLYASAYSIYSKLPSILVAVPPSANRGLAMLWWQGPTYNMD
jgi:hypothetical protein